LQRGRAMGHYETIHQAQVLNAGDNTLDDMFNDSKNAFKMLRFMLTNVEG
jgi:hypothetical protein